MLVHTDLPADATLIQRLTYKPLRSFFYFTLCYMPYAPIRRVNKPDMNGPFLWASSHSNYLCDTIPPSAEGPVPTKFLAKSTLFIFPIKGFIEFCGALPLMRAEDYKASAKEGRSGQNKMTFKAAIAAMEKGWPVTIYPEGVCFVNPGLVLPLKPGVAKLAFAAEEANDYKLGLRILPVGLEYGSRFRVGSGLTIRYGKPLVVSDYRELYQKSKDEGTKKMMEDLTREMVQNFPHFKNETQWTLGKKFVALGLARSKHGIAQLFLKKEHDEAFWTGVEQKMRAFEEASKDTRVPIPAWGHRRAWKELSPKKRIRRWLMVVLGLPIAVVDLLNNSLPEFCMVSVVEQVAVDETEKMSLRFMFSPVLLPILYGLQFLFFRKVVFEQWLSEAGFGSFVIYAFASFAVWYFGVHWRKQFKRIASLYFFQRAGVGKKSEAVACYQALRQHLGDFEDHSR